VVAWVKTCSEILRVHVELNYIPKICFMAVLNMYLCRVTGQEIKLRSILALGK